MTCHGSSNNAKCSSSAKASKCCSLKKQHCRLNHVKPEIPFNEHKPPALPNSKCIKCIGHADPADVGNSDSYKMSVPRFLKGNAQETLAHQESQNNVMAAAAIMTVPAKLVLCELMFKGHALRVFNQAITDKTIALGHPTKGNLANVCQAVLTDVFTPGALVRQKKFLYSDLVKTQTPK